jgi:hypothetical protein
MFHFLTRLTRRVPLVEQELPIKKRKFKQ